MVEGVSRSGQGRTLTAKTTGSFATPCCTCSSPTLRSFPLSFAALVSCLQRFFIREPVRKHFLPAQFPYAAHILSDGGGNARDCKDCNTARSPHAQAALRRQNADLLDHMCLFTQQAAEARDQPLDEDELEDEHSADGDEREEGQIP